MKLLTAEEIIEINKKVGERGAVLNRANLEFTIQKVSKRKSLVAKVATLLHDLVISHVFLDGNVAGSNPACGKLSSKN